MNKHKEILLFIELEAHAINTMAFIGWCGESFAFEHVTQMTTTGGTSDLHANLS